MSKVIRASIVFEFNMDEDPYFEMFGEEATEEDMLNYARETMAEDLVQMSYGSGAELINCIDAEVINV